MKPKIHGKFELSVKKRTVVDIPPLSKALHLKIAQNMLGKKEYTTIRCRLLWNVISNCNPISYKWQLLFDYPPLKNMTMTEWMNMTMRDCSKQNCVHFLKIAWIFGCAICIIYVDCVDFLGPLLLTIRKLRLLLSAWLKKKKIITMAFRALSLVLDMQVNWTIFEKKNQCCLHGGNTR